MLPSDLDPKLFTHAGKTYYMPFESTVCITKCWFYNSQDTVYKSVAELKGVYERATAQDNILILNIPPATNGKMRQGDIALLQKLKKVIK